MVKFFEVTYPDWSADAGKITLLPEAEVIDEAKNWVKAGVLDTPNLAVFYKVPRKLNTALIALNKLGYKVK
jgi:hypothetical protein